MFGIITHINNKFNVDVYSDDVDFHTQVTQTAINWVYDNVGKNNYNNTLDSEASETLCPAGYVLKYAPDKNPQKYINVYYNTAVDDKGWIWDDKKIVTEYRGFFGKVDIGTNGPFLAAKKTIETLQDRLERINADTGIIGASHKRPPHQNSVQDEMINLIKNFDFSTLRPVASKYKTDNTHTAATATKSRNISSAADLQTNEDIVYDADTYSDADSTDYSDTDDEYYSDSTESDYSSD